VAKALKPAINTSRGLREQLADIDLLTQQKANWHTDIKNAGGKNSKRLIKNPRTSN